MTHEMCSVCIAKPQIKTMGLFRYLWWWCLKRWKGPNPRAFDTKLTRKIVCFRVKCVSRLWKTIVNHSYPKSIVLHACLPIKHVWNRKDGCKGWCRRHVEFNYYRVSRRWLRKFADYLLFNTSISILLVSKVAGRIFSSGVKYLLSSSVRFRRCFRWLDNIIQTDNDISWPSGHTT